VVVVITRPSGSTHDLSLVTGAVLRGEKPDGTAFSWTAGLSLQSTSTVTLTYELAADGSDIDQAGTYKFYPRLSISGGTLDCDDSRIVAEDPLD
jgi:hypothetical protein